MLSDVNANAKGKNDTSEYFTEIKKVHITPSLF